MGKKAKLESLVVVGRENQMHLFSSLAVLAGVVAAWQRWPYVEGVVMMAIGLMVLRLAIEGLLEAVFSLMDVSPSGEVAEAMVRAALAVEGVEEVLDWRLRRAGPLVFGEVKVGVRKKIDVGQASRLAAAVEEKVRQKVAEIEALTVQVVPFKSEWQHLVLPVREKKGLGSRLSQSFGRSPYFLFVNLKGKKVVGFYFLANPYRKRAVKAGLAAAKLVAKQKSTALLTKEVGEIAFYVLERHLVDVYQTKAKTAKEAVVEFLAKKTKRLSQPTRKKEEDEEV